MFHHPGDLDPAVRADVLAHLRARHGHRYIEQYAHGDECFGLWLFLLDARLIRAIGLTHRDLPDQPWRDLYDERTDPVAYADEILTNLHNAIA